MGTTRYKARYLVLPGGEVVEHGAMDVRGDRIVAVHHALPAHDRGAVVEVCDLGEVALTPGLVNAHSHAFQRELRGRTEWLHASRAGEDFWTWREEMYALAGSLSAPEFEEVTRRCFLEMLHAGITCVGEFHYVHHQPTGELYPEPNELALRVLRAADDVGIRITLLRVAYHRAGAGSPPTPHQRRFVWRDVDSFLRAQIALENAVELFDAPQRARTHVGIAPHSVRAVPFDWLETLAAHAIASGDPIHIHANEQRGELEQSMAEYGALPVEVFDRAGLLEAKATLIHATHLSERELDLIASHDVVVCACPTTERNLGDGFLPAEELLGRGARVSLGSDSHAEIDLWQEMRLVEYNERLCHERRNVLASREIMAHMGLAHGERFEVARVLWPMSTVHGASALGWSELGELRSGYLADFVTLDLDAPPLWRVDATSLLSHLAFAAHPGCVKDVFVGGKKII